MQPFVLVLKMLAPVFVVVGAVHLSLGLGADQMLGARISLDALSDPGLDSQNRFYGVAFTIYGVLFYVGATDIRRYATVLRCLFWVFFAAGLSRLVSVATHGIPPPLIVALAVSEIVLPPILLAWLGRIDDRAARDTPSPGA